MIAVPPLRMTRLTAAAAPSGKAAREIGNQPFAITPQFLEKIEQRELFEVVAGVTPNDALRTAVFPMNTASLCCRLIRDREREGGCRVVEIENASAVAWSVHNQADSIFGHRRNASWRHAHGSEKIRALDSLLLTM